MNDKKEHGRKRCGSITVSAIALVMLSAAIVFFAFPGGDDVSAAPIYTDGDGIVYDLGMIPGAAVITDGTAYKKTDLTIPSSVEDGGTRYTVQIGDKAFRNSASLESVIISNGVTGIGNDAFLGCVALKSVTIPGSVKTIGLRAFFECSALGTLSISNGVETIGDASFTGCALRSVVIPGSVKTVGAGAFGMCFSLQSVTISEGVEVLGDSAFYYCTSLRSVVIPDSVKTISGEAFGYCHLLETVTLRDGLEDIGAGAFSECVSLKSVVIPGSVDVIKNLAFHNCRALSSVTISPGTTSIWNSAFFGCSSLRTIDIPDSVTFIGPYAFSHSGLNSVTVPGSVTAINDGAFTNCKQLESVVMGEGVATIGPYAFLHCASLRTAIIPKTVTTIDQDAFGGCIGLTTLRVPDGLTSVNDASFSGCTRLTALTIYKAGAAGTTDYTPILGIAGTAKFPAVSSVAIDSDAAVDMTKIDAITGIKVIAFLPGTNATAGATVFHTADGTSEIASADRAGKLFLRIGGTWREGNDLFLITWNMNDGSVHTFARRGVVPQAPLAPSYFDGGKLFVQAGWDKDVTGAAGNTTYTATFTEYKEPVPAKPADSTMMYIGIGGTVAVLAVIGAVLFLRRGGA